MRLPLATKRQVWELLGYRPSSEQAAAHDSDAPHVLIIGGEGGGKSTCGSMEALPHALLMPYTVDRFGPRSRPLPDAIYRDRLYWLVGPEFDDCRPEFSFLVDAIQDLLLCHDPPRLVKRLARRDAVVRVYALN